MSYRNILLSLLCISHTLRPISWQERLYGIDYFWRKTLLYGMCVAQPLSVGITHLKLADLKKDEQKNVTGPAKAFFEQILRSNGIEPDTIKFKIFNFGQGDFAAGPAMVLINEEALKQLNDALEKKDSEESLKSLAWYKFAINHEIGHIKHNDPEFIKTMGFGLGISSLQYLIAHTCLHSTTLKKYFSQPKTLGQYCKVRVSFQCLFYLIRDIIPSIPNSTRSRFKERRADTYACDQQKNSKELRLVAQKFANRHSIFVNLLSSEQSYRISWIFGALGKIVQHQYAAEKTKEPFEQWIISKHPYAYELAFYLWNPSHPSYRSRIQKLLKAAEDMEHTENLRTTIGNQNSVHRLEKIASSQADCSKNTPRLAISCHERNASFSNAA